jgi:hypothetical protein
MGGWRYDPITPGPRGTRLETADVWLVRVDAQGKLLWQRAYGGSDYDVLRIIKTTRDGGYLVGAASGSPASGSKTSPTQGLVDCWFLRLDSKGNVLWDTDYGTDGYDNIVDFYEMEDGGFTVAASVEDATELGNKSGPNIGTTPWLFRLDALGNKLGDWSQLDYHDLYLSSLTRMPNGSFLINSVATDYNNVDVLTQFITEDCDHDGVPDEIDLCPNTPPGVRADAHGCSPGQRSKHNK